jgi:hypothetical protein
MYNDYYLLGVMTAPLFLPPFLSRQEDELQK